MFTLNVAAGKLRTTYVDHITFLLESVGIEKSQGFLLPLRSLLAFCSVAVHNESEVREELEILVPYSLAGKPGAAETGSLQW